MALLLPICSEYFNFAVTAVKKGWVGGRRFSLVILGLGTREFGGIYWALEKHHVLTRNNKMDGWMDGWMDGLF